MTGIGRGREAGLGAERVVLAETGQFAVELKAFLR